MMKKLISVIILVVLFLNVSCGNAKSTQPNIVFILADDLSYRDISCFGQQRYQTPNIDALAQSGVRFTQAYAAAPECAPSRGCLMTGLHTGHGAIRLNSSARGQDNLRDEDITIAEVLKEQGYTTAFVGKWGIGLPGTEGVPYKQGFDFTFGFYDQTRAHTYIPEYLWENDKKVDYPDNLGFDMYSRYDYAGNKAINTYNPEGKLQINELINPDKYVYAQNPIHDAAISFIDANKGQDKPFFLYYATQLPHGPVIVDDIGEMNQPEDVNQLSREWAAMVIKLDKAVGSIVSKLKEEGLYDNTIIFFASDNGYSMCGYTDRGNGPAWPDDPWLRNKGPFSGGKFSVLEGGCRIPFFVHWPKQIAPKVSSEVVWLPDFFPTAVNIAGGNSEDYQTDGLDLMPLLKGAPFKGHDYLYFSRKQEQALRMGPWKVYRKSPGNKVQLYLVEEDTYTQRDLSAIYPDVALRATQILDSEHVPHPWYWDPTDNAQDYQKKKEKARETGNVLPVYRPNGIDAFPWEKK